MQQQQEIDDTMAKGKKGMNDAIDHFVGELSNIRTGKASPAMLNSIMVEYYGSPTPLNQVANVGSPDARTITVQPWEKTMFGPIEKAIISSNLGFNPQNDGEKIIINIPPLTEETRKRLVKQAKEKGEDAKVSIRNVRKTMMDSIKKAVKNGYPEDLGKKTEGEVQNMVDQYNKKVDSLLEVKEKDILKV